jgi:uncharacterized protein (DUF934 family)
MNAPLAPGAFRRHSVSILLRDGVFVEDPWLVLREEGDGDPAVEPLLLPLQRYLEQSDSSPLPPTFGVWLAPTDDAAQVRGLIASLPLIAIDFPKSGDGRGYSLAAQLRGFGYRGELRAIGEVVIDQLVYLRRVGFTSFSLRAGQDPAAAIAALRTFSETYQGTYEQPLPSYRRHARPAAVSRPAIDGGTA